MRAQTHLIIKYTSNIPMPLTTYANLYPINKTESPLEKLLNTERSGFELPVHGQIHGSTLEGGSGLSRSHEFVTKIYVCFVTTQIYIIQWLTRHFLLCHEVTKLFHCFGQWKHTKSAKPWPPSITAANRTPTVNFTALHKIIPVRTWLARPYLFTGIHQHARPSVALFAPAPPKPDSIRC